MSSNMEPHRQACGTSCYAQTGDILSKEHSPTAKPVVLCVEGEKYAAMTKDAAQRRSWTFYEAVKVELCNRLKATQTHRGGFFNFRAPELA